MDQRSSTKDRTKDRTNDRLSPGLTGAQLAHLRTKLMDARAEALRRLREEEETARSTDRPIESMDAAELSREQGDGALFAARTRTLIREIDEALARMEIGRYGISERSGDAIGFARLDAMPWARVAADEDS
jgi:DnaK suppressor protein